MVQHRGRPECIPKLLIHIYTTLSKEDHIVNEINNICAVIIFTKVNNHNYCMETILQKAFIKPDKTYSKVTHATISLDILVLIVGT